MNSDDIDKLAFALLTSIKWAVDGGKVEDLPKVHEFLAESLDPLFSNQDLDSLRERKKSLVLNVLQKNNGNINQTARELNVSRWTVHRCIENKKTA